MSDDAEREERVLQAFLAADPRPAWAAALRELVREVGVDAFGPLEDLTGAGVVRTLYAALRHARATAERAQQRDRHLQTRLTLIERVVHGDLVEEERLVEEAVRRAGQEAEPAARWLRVQQVFGVHEARARQLAHRYGLRPADLVGRPKDGTPGAEAPGVRESSSNDEGDETPESPNGSAT